MQQSFEHRKKKAGEKGLRSEVSVFLALITVLVASLILSSVELLRSQAARTYLQTAANSAVDSLFSQYHLELWKKYRLLGLEMYAEEEIVSEYSAFLEPYLSVKDAWNWYGLSEEQDGVQISEFALMTDENGAVFEENVKDYMIYGWTMDADGLAEAQKEMSVLESAAGTGESAKELEKCSDKAWKLQKKLNALSDSVKDHNSQKKELVQALAQGNGTRVHALLQKVKRSLYSIRDAVEDVRRSAATLGTEVDVAEVNIKKKYSAGTLTEENYTQLIGQLENYRAYSDESSAQTEELAELEAAVAVNEEMLDRIESAAEEAEEYIRSWVPEQILVRYDPPKKEGDPPIPVYEDEVLDEAAVWGEAVELFDGYEDLTVSLSRTAVDEERAAQLDSVTNLLSGNLLLLVLPDADKISREERNLTEAPSKLYLMENTNVFNDGDYLLSKIAVSKYAMAQLSNLKAEAVTADDEGADAGEGTDSLCKPELEYVLHGCKSDYQNVAAVAAELVGIRTGLNLSYLLSNKDAKTQAGSLAVAVTGAAAGTPLVYVVTFLILSIWAAGQAVLDVRELFDGGKVPLMHTKKTFTLTLKGLLTGFKEELAGKRSNESGMDYRDWLRVLLYSRSGSKTDYRIMDIIQENLRKEQEDFRMDRLYTALDLSVSAVARHVFINPGTFSGRDYRLTVNTYYAYSE